ncbi:GspH/FimT family pseudopilin [Vibrio sp. D173a]|uniref:GspH/FimT family pseudopilin n=1 Tax=Vibrio sp. D173a TaxID=2836349 RepID=UPI002553CB5D|nr:GspH/FimT family pseudopilin [Vibrio sp. D173a]MDK9759633.1 GspH/FimT family pseudopilin [Vibrio sp. D173a]
MTRGFTLLELLITVVVLSVLLAAAAPSFSSLLASSKLQRLAPEVHGFFITARSEAVTRNKELYILFLVSGGLGTTESSDGNWDLVLSSTASYVPSNVLMKLDGSTYRDIKADFNFSNSTSVAIDNMRGRFRDGNVSLASTNAPTDVLSIIVSKTTGRIRICSSDPNSEGRNSIGHYGYEICD